MNAKSSNVCVLAYCVPVMNRLDDLQQTLAHNLAAVRPFAGRAQVVVTSFDSSLECSNWVQATFREDLESGILEFTAAEPLPYWHFCWAKNAFRNCLRTQYYSSLDGDNLLSGDEVGLTLQLLESTPRDVLIHHFSGNWGDGTSGRITLPVPIFNKLGYPTELLPRQADDLALILETLCRYQNIRFLTRRGVDIFQISDWLSQFKRINALSINRVEVDLGSQPQPLNPRGDGYTFNDRGLFWLQKLNSNYIAWKLSATDRGRELFSTALQDAQRRFARSPQCPAYLFQLFAGEDLARLKKTPQITLYSVNRNHHDFLPAWFDHYRHLGIERFVLVDDGSDPPLQDRFSQSDTYIVSPRYGSFRVAKAFWLQALMASFQVPGSWVFTADTDEFIDLEPTISPFPPRRGVPPQPSGAGAMVGTNLSHADRLIAHCKERGRRFYSGILVDMMPNPDADSIDARNYTRVLDHFYYRPLTPSSDYQHFRAVRWAWGEYWTIAYCLDVRYHFFGTYDCLRKVPLFQYHPKIDVHQGLHSLLVEGRNLSWRELLDPTAGLLPIRHFKMAIVLGQATKPGHSGLLERADQYFERTQQNLRQIHAIDKDFIRRAWQATPFKRRYTGAEGFPFYSPSVL